jgi:hypothetical protein
MLTKRAIQSIKNENERFIEGLVTSKNEFIYQDNNGIVKPNTTYSVYYTLDKQEIYLTGLLNTNNSRVILKQENDTNFSQYVNIGNNTRVDYPKPFSSSPSDGDYKIGEIIRYFTQQANDSSKPVFEIDKKTFNTTNSLFNYVSFTWKISGLKQDVERENQMTINRLIRDFPTITKELFPLQLWTPPKDSMEDVENKLRRLKK